MRQDEMLPIQRAGLIVWYLAHGETLPTWRIAEMLGMSRPSAYRMMCLLSQNIPIYADANGWQVCALREVMSD